MLVLQVMMMMMTVVIATQYYTILYFRKSSIIHKPSYTHCTAVEVVKTYKDLHTELDSPLKLSGKTDRIVKATKPNNACVEKTKLL